MYKYSKDGVSIITILDTRRNKKNGCFPIKIQVVCNRLQKYYQTGKELTKEDWEILPTTKSKKLILIREDIETSYSKVKGFIKNILEDGDFSFEALDIRIGRSSIDTVNSAFKHKIEELKEEERVGTKSFYECALNSFTGFAGEKIAFENINVQWLKKYEKQMVDSGKSYTTIGMYIRGLRTIFNESIKSGMIKPSLYPFGKGKYEIPVGEGRKLALSLKQIKEVISYTNGNEATEHYRDLWFFSYLCNGINVMDLIKLKFKDISDGELSFYRSKTIKTSKKKTKIQAIVIPEMEKIINRWGNPDKSADNYIFPFLKGNENAERIKAITSDVTRRINLRMSEISKALNLPHISTYTARHSFATILNSFCNLQCISA